MRGAILAYLPAAPTAAPPRSDSVNDPLSTFIVLFAVIDPVGTVPVFLAVTSQHEERSRKSIAVKATLIAAMILLFFISVGELLLNAMEVPLAAFEIAGGIVLFLFALSMIFGESKPDEEMRMVRSGTETAIFPLAIPSIASPGAMLAAVLLTENSRFEVLEQAVTALIMLGVLAITLALMLTATHIQRLIGAAGASIVSRVMGLILSSIAVASVLSGIESYFGL